MSRCCNSSRSNRRNLHRLANQNADLCAQLWDDRTIPGIQYTARRGGGRNRKQRPIRLARERQNAELCYAARTARAVHSEAGVELTVFALRPDYFSQCTGATASRRAARDAVAESSLHARHQIAIAAARTHQHPAPALRAAEVG